MRGTGERQQLIVYRLRSSTRKIQKNVQFAAAYTAFSKRFRIQIQIVSSHTSKDYVTTFNGSSLFLLLRNVHGMKFLTTWVWYLVGLGISAENLTLGNVETIDELLLRTYWNDFSIGKRCCVQENCFIRLILTPFAKIYALMQLKPCRKCRKMR